MRVLYGGTFDPVHLGHLAIATAVGDALACPVSLVPAADPPHRSRPGASADQRATMLDLAIAGDTRMCVDRRELHRAGPSFTVDTLEQVRLELAADEPLVWVLGIDSVIQLASWHRWRRIFALAHVLGVERPGTSVDLRWLGRHAAEVHAEARSRWQEPSQLAATPCGGYAALAMHPPRLESATEVRRRIDAGLPWDTLVPAAVARYIRDTGLYGAGVAG